MLRLPGATESALWGLHLFLFAHSPLFTLHRLVSSVFLSSFPPLTPSPLSRPFYTPAFPQKVLFTFLVTNAIFLGEELDQLSLGPVSTPGPMICDQDVRLSRSINMALASPPLQLCMGVILETGPAGVQTPKHFSCILHNKHYPPSLSPLLTLPEQVSIMSPIQIHD